MTTRLLLHGFGIAAATALVILATILPFLPGQYDMLAAPLSAMAQIFGKIGLVLVPIGALWVASGYWSRLAGKQHGIAMAALIASSVVWLIASLGALAFSSPLLSIGAIALWFCVVLNILPQVRLLKGVPRRPSNPAGFYLLIVPIATALLQIRVATPATEFSRNRAIRNSAPLIAEIEQYRARRGHYPVSLMSVQPDLHPGIIGIKEYLYEPSGDAYNLFFEQLAFAFGTREFVMYNPLDQQAMTSHRLDVLQLTPEALALDQTRGHNAVHAAPFPHWKYFWFD